MKKLIEKVQTNDLEQQPGRTIMESFENQVGGWVVCWAAHECGACASAGACGSQPRVLCAHHRWLSHHTTPHHTLPPPPAPQVNQVLNKARDDAGNMAQQSLHDTNNVVRMVTAGSKGSFINISQVRGWLG